jgi:CheY-like chemotaxis protein
MTTVGERLTKAVRVVIVDDSEDIRMLLHAQFSHDDRFEVVGEASDGFEAIGLARELQPDLLILDQQMPGRNGLDAIEDIRMRAPNTAVIVYTAHADHGVYQAAFDAGAVDVLEKVAIGHGFVQQIVETLIDRASIEEVTMDIHVGPVAGSSARIWIANTRKVLEAVIAHPEVLGFYLPDDVKTIFMSFLDQWEAIAATADELRLVVRSSPGDVYRLAHYWGAIDAMSDKQLQQLGITWAPPEGAPFFEALSTGVLEALRRHDETKRIAARLSEQWAAAIHH